MIMHVIKADGKKEDFDEEKIVKTCVRAGASEKTAREIAKTIKAAAKESITTHEIYRLIVSELDKREDKSSLLFRLREAVTGLDAESFELYTKKVLEANGYACKWNEKIKGMYVEHQVDVIAKSKDGLFLVECKRHVNPHRYTGLNVCLQVQARLDDINEGFRNKKNSYRFDGAWLVTNGKFSDHAKMYAKGKGIRLTGWRYEGKFSLEKLVQDKRIFPVTMMKITPAESKQLLENKILTINDFLASKFSAKKEFKGLVEQAKILT